MTSLYKHTAKLDFFILNLVQINLFAGTKDNNIDTCVLWSRIQQIETQADSKPTTLNFGTFLEILGNIGI